MIVICDQYYQVGTKYKIHTEATFKIFDNN